MRTIIAGLLMAVPAVADVTQGAWTSGYQMGTAWVSIGKSGGAGWLSLQCTQAGRSALILSEIGGRKPPAGSSLTLAVTSRGGTRTHRFAIDPRGEAAIGAGSPAFLALWNDLRRGGSVTVRHAGGRSWTSRIDGAGAALTPGGCVD